MYSPKYSGGDIATEVLGQNNEQKTQVLSPPWVTCTPFMSLRKPCLLVLQVLAALGAWLKVLSTAQLRLLLLQEEAQPPGKKSSPCLTCRSHSICSPGPESKLAFLNVSVHTRALQT